MMGKRRPGWRIARVLLMALLLVGVMFGPGAVAAPGILGQPAAALDSGNEIDYALGFDTACAPTAAQMQTLWTNSPWFFGGVYIGGNNISCKSNTNLTASWLNTVHNQGWWFSFFWVGDQAPCASSGFYRMSSDQNTAYNDGFNNGSSSTDKLINTLGVTNSAAGTPVTYDMEGYGQPSWSSSCQLAVDAFMRGWTTYLHLAPAQKSGYYGSSCGSNVDALAGISPTVDYIHGAAWNNTNPDPNPNNLPCVNSGHWVNSQRLKQYENARSASNYGVSITVDYDCAHGPVAPSGTQLNANC